MLSQVAFVRKSEYEADSDEEPRRDKKRSADKKEKHTGKDKKKKHRHKVSKLKEGRDSADEGRGAGASASPPLSASPAPSGELSPVRVREEAGGRGVLETTPPPDDAAAAAAPQGDELDALLGPAVARERPGRKNDKDAAEAAPEPVVGLQSRGSTLTAETVVIGDGGASWRRRAQQRSRQRAAEEGRSVGDGALQRSERAASGAGPSNRDAERRRGGRDEDRHAGRAAYLRSDEDVAAWRMRRIDSGDANTAFRGRRSDAKTQDEPGAAPGRATGEARANGRGGGEMVRVTAPANAKASADIEAAASPASGGNFGAAAALRARIRGTAAPEAARAEFSILPQVDSKGRAAPGAFGRERAGARTAPGRDAVKRVQRFEGGEKVRHFRDDDAADLAALVKRARHGDDLRDLDAAFAANVARDARYKGRAQDVDDEYDVDGGLDMYEDRRRRGTREQQEERAHKAAVADARRVSAAAARCALCLASAKCPRELLLSLGQQTYMALPPRGALAPGHVVICAAEHVPSFRAADENVFEELKNFRKCLIQMFATQDKSVVFMETAVRVQEGRAHACVHAVPLAADAFARAPLVFRQELDGAESEWAQHHAQRLIDSGAKGLRRSIPEKFPYFHVEFGYNRGYVHVIDDEAAWPRDFGRGVLLGLLGRDEEMHARAQRAGAGAAAAQAAEFLEGWEAFDWTKQL